MLWPPGTVHGNSASYESQSPRFKSLSQYLGSLDEKGMFSKLHRYDKHINKHQQTEFKWLNGSNPFTVTSTPIGIIRAQPEGAPTLHCDFALGSVRSINSKNSLLIILNPLLKLNFLFGGDLKSPIEPQTGFFLFNCVSSFLGKIIPFSSFLNKRFQVFPSRTRWLFVQLQLHPTQDLRMRRDAADYIPLN